MRSGIIVMFYNEITALKKQVPALKKMTKNLLYIDGRFDHFPSKSRLSDDGSRQYLKRQGVEVLDCPGDIFAKTNFSLVEGAKRFDVALRLDCDETLYGSWPDFVKCMKLIPVEHLYNVCFYDIDGYYNKRRYMERVVRDFKEVRCKYRHWILVKDGIRQRANRCLPLMIIHDSDVRDQDREDKMTDFQNNYNFEIEFKIPVPRMKDTLQDLDG